MTSPDRQAGEAGALHPGGTALTRRALQAAGLPPGARLLDLGCGEAGSLGLPAEALCPAGLDQCLEALQAGRSRNPAAALVCGLVQRLPFAAGAWETLLAECSLSACGALDAALAECRRVLAPGGKLVISDLYQRRPPGGPLSQAEWLQRLHSHGFAVRVWEDHTPALTAWAGAALLSGRPLAELWGCRPDGARLCAGAPVGGAPLSGAGYFLLVAEKIEQEQVR
ncbi:MAG: DVU_1556 family methyltransferase [Chloroflexota bacterium]